MANVDLRRFFRTVGAGLVTALVVGCTAGIFSVWPDRDHLPKYLWLLWPERFSPDPGWFGRPLHITDLVFSFVLLCVTGALFIGLSMAAFFLKRSANKARRVNDGNTSTCS